MTNVTHPLKKGYRSIPLLLAESEYDRFLSDRAYAKSRLDELYEAFPELFPEAFPWGYALYGFTEPSIKQETYCRRIRMDQGQAVFTIAPAFIMPYMTGRTQEVDDASFLMRFNVPYWAIAHVFGRDAMYWYRWLASDSTCLESTVRPDHSDLVFFSQKASVRAVIASNLARMGLGTFSDLVTRAIN